MKRIAVLLATTALIATSAMAQVPPQQPAPAAGGEMHGDMHKSKHHGKAHHGHHGKHKHTDATH